MEYINYVKQSPIAGITGFGVGATNLNFHSSVAGARGVWAGGTPVGPTMDFVDISTTGNALSFGNLSQSRSNTGGCSNGTRGCFAGGNVPYGQSNVIDYITISTESNATDFGDLDVARSKTGALGNDTRGVWGGGDGGGADENMSYVTIANTGNAQDFGDFAVQHRYATSGAASATRGLFMGGYGPNAPSYSYNTISYITIANTGDTSDFGDLSNDKSYMATCDNDTRACAAGGQRGGPTTYFDTIEYVTIASTGNVTDFGDLTVDRGYFAGVSDKTAGVDRGAFGGGFDDTSNYNTIDYITISTTGNAQDFGDLTRTDRGMGACSGG